MYINHAYGLIGLCHPYKMVNLEVVYYSFTNIAGYISHKTGAKVDIHVCHSQKFLQSTIIGIIYPWYFFFALMVGLPLILYIT